MDKRILNFLILFVFLLTSCSLSWERNDAISNDVIDSHEILCPEGVTPEKETCNGKDDDCDGLVDEDFECQRFQILQCTTTCGSTGLGSCTADCRMPVVCNPPVEVCNGQDDDCDGLPDNGHECIMGETRNCSTSCGQGTQTCIEAGGLCKWGTCEGAGECDAGNTQDCTFMLECGHGMRTCDENCLWGACSQEPREEVCDENVKFHDNDCDTIIDEGENVKRKLTSDIRVTNTSVPSQIPVVVWNGSNFLISWLEGFYNDDPALSSRQVFAVMLNESGDKIIDDVQLTDSAGDHQIAIPVVGSLESAIFWADYRSMTGYDIYMAKLNLWGGIIASDILLVDSTSNALAAGASWSGLNYGVAWQDDRADSGMNDIFFEIFTKEGTPVTSALNLTATTGQREEMPLTPMWTGSEYLVIYNAADENNVSRCNLVRLDSSGRKISENTVLVDEDGVACFATWIDSSPYGFRGFAMTWMNSFAGDASLRMGLFDPSGGIIAGPVTVFDNHPTSSVLPVPHFNLERNNSIAISWVEQEFPVSGGECWFAEVSANPSNFGVVTPAFQVSESGGTVDTLCTNAWSGSVYGLAWSARNDDPNAPEIYFALVGCP